jgi:hypothetical protein
MKLDHDQVNFLLAEYVAGTLSAEQHQAVETHLAVCPQCREELAFWHEMSAAVQPETPAERPSTGIVDHALTAIRTLNRRPDPLRQTWNILRAQIPLVRGEIWPASLAVMVIGYVAAVLVGKEAVIQLLAPLVAAATIAMIYNPQHEPIGELVFATPVHPRQIVLARLALVFFYNFSLAILACLCLMPVFENLVLQPLVMAWLAPMTFLSALALFLSILFGSENAIALTYGLWLLQFAAGGANILRMAGSDNWLFHLLSTYAGLWQSPQLLYLSALVLFSAALWSVGLPRFTNRSLAF